MIIDKPDTSVGELAGTIIRSRQDVGAMALSRVFTLIVLTPAAEAAALDGAYGLAGVALDYLYDDALADAVHEEFESAGGAVAVPHFFD